MADETRNDEFSEAWEIVFYVAFAANVILALLVWMKIVMIWYFRRTLSPALCFHSALLAIVVLRGVQFFMHSWTMSFDVGVIWIIPSYLFFMIYCYLVFLWAKLVYAARNLHLVDRVGWPIFVVFWGIQLFCVTVLIVCCLFHWGFEGSSVPILVCDYFFMSMQAIAAVVFCCVGCELFRVLARARKRFMFSKHIVRARRRQSHLVLLATCVCTVAFNAKVVRVALWHAFDRPTDWIIFFVVYPFCEVIPILLILGTIHVGRGQNDAQALSRKSDRDFRQDQVRQMYLDGLEAAKREQQLHESLLAQGHESDEHVGSERSDDDGGSRSRHGAGSDALESTPSQQARSGVEPCGSDGGSAAPSVQAGHDDGGGVEEFELEHNLVPVEDMPTVSDTAQWEREAHEALRAQLGADGGVAETQHSEETDFQLRRATVPCGVVGPSDVVRLLEEDDV